MRQLVDEVNRDPRRGDGHATSLTKIRLDDIALARLAAQGLAPESVPRKGQRVVLRNNANLSTGGTATDVTDDVHPEVAARAVAAAQMVGLDICGVDVVCESVLKPLEEQSGGVVEVNAAPGPAHAPVAVVRQGPRRRRGDHRRPCSPTATTAASRWSR